MSIEKSRECHNHKPSKAKPCYSCVIPSSVIELLPCTRFNPYLPSGLHVGPFQVLGVSGVFLYF